jgi:stage V sporulation protein R
LENIFEVWTRPVHIETVVEDEPKRLSFDGEEHSEKSL